MATINRLLPALTLSLFLVACSKTPKNGANRSAEYSRHLPELKMEALKVQSYDVDGIQWEMTAPLGQGFTQRNVMIVENMNIQLYEKGQPSSQVTADHAIMATGEPDPSRAALARMNGTKLLSGDMYLSGNVVVISTDGNKLTTDWVHYHKKTELITSTAPVTVIRPDSITKGIGLEASADLSRVKIFKETLIIPDTDENKKL